MHPALVPGVIAAIVSPLLATGAAVARAHEPTALSYAWRAGETHRYRVVQKFTATLTSGEAGEAPVSLGRLTDLVVRLEIREVDEAGTATAAATFEAIRAELRHPAAPPMSYDSGAGEEIADEDTFGVVMGALLTAELTLTITAGGEVPKLSGINGIWEKAAAARPAIAHEIRNARGVISDASIRDTLTQAFHVLPGRALEVGESCPLTTAPIGDAAGALHTTGTTTLKEVARGDGGNIAHLAAAYTVTAGPADAPHLEGSGERTTTFDLDKGVALKSDATMTATSPAKDDGSKQELTTVVRLERLSANPPAD